MVNVGNHTNKTDGSSDRITVLLDQKHVKKLRAIQSKKILSTNKNVSFSRVLNEILEDYFK